MTTSVGIGLTSAVWITVCVIVLNFATPAYSGAISLDTWYEFSFTDPGVPATGCAPDDPAGGFCLASSGTPTTFLDAPPWTFTTLLGAVLTVTDAFDAGDQFEVFDFSTSLGVTSVPVGSGNCGDDPVSCLADPNTSHAVFSLLPGGHSITIVPTLSPSGAGAGFLQVSAVPEPGTSFLFGSGIVFLGWWKRKRGSGVDTLTSAADRAKVVKLIQSINAATPPIP